ncbi:MAG TPA: prepilin-type N-terminal cleavage/methylation domain-containing protein [Chitinivibrionales bacterium]|jgi:prepilin-type N-terminal cleavage/methylation domain-containing protein|nr:prepilin-type N-terminal cleavage/methylation domain-containing protein [Chitinivibrionales bacterium]
MLMKGGSHVAWFLRHANATVSRSKKSYREGLSMRYLLFKTKGFTLVELMVVIVIIGILAAVAIPKFMDAAQKAKASEFPTQLSGIYSGQLAYQAQGTGFLTSLQALKDSAYVDVSSSSRWFAYAMPSASATSFTAVATVQSPGFGTATTSDYGQIDQTNSKYCTTNLQRYCPSWR